MFLAAVLNAYLQSADAADAAPVIDRGANDDVSAPQGLALAKVRANAVHAEQAAATHTDARQVRARR
jgi:hypothetical protein